MKKSKCLIKILLPPSFQDQRALLPPRLRSLGWHQHTETADFIKSIADSLSKQGLPMEIFELYQNYRGRS